MTSAYFQAILPTTVFTPNVKASIRGIPVDEQFDGLVHLYNDALSNYRRDDYLFYNFWTGFLYALSRSNVIELFLFIDRNKTYKPSNKLELIVAARISAYFWKFFYIFLKSALKHPHTANSKLLKTIMDKLIARGYMESKDKQKIVEDVLSEIIESHEFDDIKDFLKLVLEILRRSNRLDTTFDLIR